MVGVVGGSATGFWGAGGNLVVGKARFREIGDWGNLRLGELRLGEMGVEEIGEWGNKGGHNGDMLRATQFK